MDIGPYIVASHPGERLYICLCRDRTGVLTSVALFRTYEVTLARRRISNHPIASAAMSKNGIAT